MNLDLGYFQNIFFNVATEFQNTAECHREPSAIYKPNISRDGNKWMAIYGDLPTGVVGIGDSPSEAMQDFNKEWVIKISNAA